MARPLFGVAVIIDLRAIVTALARYLGVAFPIAELSAMEGLAP